MKTIIKAAASRINLHNTVFMSRFLPVLFALRNKFLFTTVAFAVWMLFFDKNDLFAQLEKKKQLRELHDSRLYFTAEIEKERRFSADLRNNPAIIEKFAREQYLMKRDNEDLYLVVPVKD